MKRLGIAIILVAIIIASMSFISAATSAKIQFFNGNTAASTNTIYTNFKLVNTGTDPITLSNVKMRYYFTNDGTQSNSFACDWATAGNSNITGSFVTITAVTGADRYLEVGFTSGAGTLAAGAATEVKIRLWKSDWSNFTQANDYSFNATATNYIDSTTVTAYISGTLYWGTPAGGSTVTPTPVRTTTPVLTATPVRVTTPTPIRTASPVRTPTAARTASPVATATPTPSPTPVTVTPTPAPGMPDPVFSGASYDLTGSNYYQSPVLNISGNQPWTMACWVYQRGTSDEKDPGYQNYRPNPNYISKCVMGWGTSGTKTANCLYVNPVTMNFEYGFDSSSIGTTPNYSHYTWYHVASTYDGTTQRIYINGNLVTTRTPGTLSLANTALTIGRDPSGSSRYLTGKVQQAKVYNVALTAAQVSSLTTTLPAPLNGYGISTAIPPALSFLDTSFYKKCYKTPLGVYIISSNRVGNHSLALCGQLIDTVMAGVKAKYPAVYTSMLNYNCRVVIQSYMEQTTDVPEWTNLTSSNYARGMGGINGSPFSGCGEENVHHESFCAYRNENIIVHEFGHSLQGHGLYNGARAVYDEIRNAYNEAVSKGLWVNTYPGSNFNEYFANGVQTWYNVAAQSSSGQPDGTHNYVNLRSELQTYDTRLYNVLNSLLNPDLLPDPWTVHQ
jgi:hypothetical protein